MGMAIELIHFWPEGVLDEIILMRRFLIINLY
jgi:hypothetical protein